MLLVSLGCESMDRHRLRRTWVAAQRAVLDAALTVPMQTGDLVVGTVCSGSDRTSELTGNPAAGIAFDRLGAAEGGLTTIEEKSLGAYAKSGSAPIVDLTKPGDISPHGGLYLLDVVPDGPVRWGFPNINDNAEIAELIGPACLPIVTGPYGPAGI